MYLELCLLCSKIKYGGRGVTEFLVYIYIEKRLLLTFDIKSHEK